MVGAPVSDLQQVDRLRLASRSAFSDPLVQTVALAALILTVASAGSAAGWFAMALFAGVSLSGSP